MKDEILSLVREKGLLLEKALFEVLDSFDSLQDARDFLEGLEKASGNKVITVSNLSKNFEYVKEVVNHLPGQEREVVERFLVKGGLNLEITKEREVVETKPTRKLDYKVFYADGNNARKIEVRDFVSHFRVRYQALQRILMARPEVQQNLISLNKLGMNRESFVFIGIVAEKRITKNKNLIIKFEDLTGEINALVKPDSDCFKEVNELQMDDVVAVKASGNKELAFIYNIFWPESILLDKTRFDEEVCVAFLSDIHAGSKNHLGKEFQKFINWLNEDELAKKIKYMFLVGDNIDGVGIFPGQERLLERTSAKEQYEMLSEYLKQVPKNITMFMCPGQHDAVRVPEPQPVIGRDYGEALYDIDNLVLVSNPAMVKLMEKDKEFKVLMYHGASIHVFINEIEELRLMKAHKCPAKAIKHMLKRRHLAPMHGVAHSIVYVPHLEKDPLVIEEVPDVLCMGEVHRLDIDSYNGVRIITGSCWQSQTEYEEKIGNVPEACKVSILNLKTGEIKILDFSEDEN
ncbi:hypothetical protein AUJ63_02865 [Candidatus Pacearchaeota archaeon CG1_02_35_32]|nr:MAG: hypothetical protein AUJ63_02865 [Candidatus Pacearchaeota archaeon CG1_02_35_32]